MSNEKERILKMLEEGRINAEEAYRLLEGANKKKRKGKSLKIKVESDGEQKANISIPLGLASKLMKIGGDLIVKFSPEAREKLEEHNIKIKDILNAIEEEIDEVPMTIVDIEEDDERVKIWIE